MTLVNAPFGFATLWSAVSFFLNARMKAKVGIFGDPRTGLRAAPSRATPKPAEDERNSLEGDPPDTHDARTTDPPDGHRGRITTGEPLRTHAMLDDLAALRASGLDAYDGFASSACVASLVGRDQGDCGACYAFAAATMFTLNYCRAAEQRVHERRLAASRGAHQRCEFGGSHGGRDIMQDLEFVFLA